MVSSRIVFPPGAYLIPIDEDIIHFFFKPKVLGENLVFDVVEDKQVYGPNCNPWQIFDLNTLDSWFVAPFKKYENVMYVFTKLSKIRKEITDEGRLNLATINMHEYTLSGGIYGGCDLASTLVLCNIAYDSSKKSSYVKKNNKPSLGFLML
ncbi:hypothetical protein POM88_007470 [Heracleum sosnowskyi]|uniref:Uncharacterized protein n=1 Tax=Heracleum sosnowskyi TaxID=360622 RepID=A0AAD8N697_9APIA|nr:hypothetical protein POM88_007470 [Heracleum sosnowskyi]